MQFSFTDDQQLIADTAAAFFKAESTSERIRAAMASSKGVDEVLWTAISSEMGWHLAIIPEHHGGLGLGYVELVILFEQAGKYLACAPFFSNVAQSINALRVLATSAQQSSYFSAFAKNPVSMTLAWSAPGRSATTDNIGGQYSLVDGQYYLNGEYAYVVDGHKAEKIIVIASNKQAVQAFVIDAKQAGVECMYTATLDQTRKQATIKLDQVKVDNEQRLGVTDNQLDGFAQVQALAAICLAAEQLGVADKALQMTVEYITERKQFGRPVGSFQAMKHKAADMMSQVEAARSAVYYAACVADEFFAHPEEDQDLLEAASIAKVTACEAAFFNSGCAIQMHGGVGFTWEYDVHLYFKRAKAAQWMLGDSAWHKERLASLLLGAI